MAPKNNNTDVTTLGIISSLNAVNVQSREFYVGKVDLGGLLDGSQ